MTWPLQGFPFRFFVPLFTSVACSIAREAVKMKPRLTSIHLSLFNCFTVVSLRDGLTGSKEEEEENDLAEVSI